MLIKKAFILAIASCFLLTGCDKKKSHDHDHTGHDHAHEGHDHAHKGHDHAHQGHDHAHQGHKHGHQDHAEVKAKDPEKKVAADKGAIKKTVEAGCGMCIFKMEGEKKCRLAVKIDGKSYIVEGASMGDHGDAHAEGGMYKVGRMADVEGTIEGNVFKATSFKLKPPAKK